MAKDKKGTVTPKLRFSEFRGQEGWCSRELGPMARKVGSGITPTGGERNYKTSGRPFVRSQNVGWGELILDDVAYIDEETHSSFDSSEIEALDVLLNITGASIGRSAVADPRIVGGNVNQHVCIIRVKPDELNPVLLNQYLISEHGQKQIDSFQAGGNRQGLNFGQIRSFNITLPPTDGEQTRIADCLTSLDELIAAQGRRVEALKAHKKGLMQQLFPREGETLPRLRFPKFRDAPKWDSRLLGLVCDLKAGAFVSASAISDEQKDDLLPCYGGNGLRGYVTSSTHEGLHVLVGRQGALCGNVNLLSGKFHATEHALVATPKPGIEVAWLYYALTSLRLNRFAIGQAQPGLSVTVLNAVAMVVPATKAEQRRNADCLSALDARITAEADKLTALKAHKQGLMQQLFPSPEDSL